MIDLKNNGISEPNLKSRLLMQFILDKPRQYLIVYDNQQLTLRQEVDYFKAIKKLTKGIPIQHITHSQEFMKNELTRENNQTDSRGFLWRAWRKGISCDSIIGFK